MTVVIQAGHVNIGDNIDWALRGQTGAKGEVEYTPQIAAEVAGALHAHGIDAMVVDANFNGDSNVARDYDAFVSLHCQSDPPNTSGFSVGTLDPALDGSAQRSADLVNNLKAQYAAATGLEFRPEWVEDNQNVTRYYMFGVLSKATPCALIEMGDMGPDAEWLNANKDKVGAGIVNGILAFLGIDPAVPVDPNSPPPVVQVTQTNTPTPEPTPQPTPAVTLNTSAIKQGLQSAIAALQEVINQLPD